MNSLFRETSEHNCLLVGHFLNDAIPTKFSTITSRRFNYELIRLPQTRQTQNERPLSLPPTAHLSITSSVHGGVKILYQVVWRPAVYLRGTSSYRMAETLTWEESLGVVSKLLSSSPVELRFLLTPRFNKLFMMQWNEQSYAVVCHTSYIATKLRHSVVDDVVATFRRYACVFLSSTLMFLY